MPTPWRPGREEQPGGDAQQRLTGEQRGVAVGERVDDAAGDAGDCGEPNQRDRRETTQAGAPSEVGDGDRTGQHGEGDAALRDRKAEVVGDGREQRRQHLLAGRRDEVRQAEHGEHAPMGTAGAPTSRRPGALRSPRRAVSSISHTVCNRVNGLLHIDDATIAGLLDPSPVTDSLGAAFAAWGRGEAATTQRVRAAAGGLMASAMAAVVPPYSGGKVYATRQGRVHVRDRAVRRRGPAAVHARR